MAHVDFGLVLQTMPRPGMEPADLNGYNQRAIETLSSEFSTIWVEDHFQWDEQPTLEAFATMAYLAARYPAYRFGSLVFGQSYRNPALLAKMLATLQYLTAGRITAGIGAGWKEDEYRSYGYPYPRAGVRIEQLAEAVQVMKAVWTQSPASFAGQHYHVDQAWCEPRPRPAIPLLVGGAGERGTLRVVAQHADAWNHDSCTFDEYEQKFHVLQARCNEVGRDVKDIQLTYYGHVDLPDKIDDFAPRTDIYVLGPTPRDVVAQLQPFVRLGVAHIMIQPSSLATLKRFCAEVAPAVALASA